MELLLSIKKLWGKLPAEGPPPVVLLVAGAVLLALPAGVFLASVRILGGVMLLYGGLVAVPYFSAGEGEDRGAPWKFLAGAVCAAVGLVILIAPNALVNFIPGLAGLILTALGALRLMQALNAKKQGEGGWQVKTVLASVTLFLGVLVFANPFGAVNTVLRVVGAVLVYYGVLGLASQFRERKKKKQDEAAQKSEAPET